MGVPKGFYFLIFDNQMSLTTILDFESMLECETIHLA